ncbi:transmembrane protein CCDC163 isoform X8 [Callorhinus ursinus]|uniref:transmembrane protein CCDC163 isoform X8 n=1 Tax=Callorhinus ursinus TaxID=34884 RepID=UPI003CD047FA
MSRSLSWSEHLDALLNATDGNVARIKQRLYPLGVSTAGDLVGTWISPHHLPPQSGVQARQPWALETPFVPERLSWAEAQRAASLWDEVTILRSQLQSQAQVTEALRQSVQGLLEDREQQKYQICALEGLPFTSCNLSCLWLPPSPHLFLHLALKSVFWTISRGAHFLNWSPAAYSSRPRALSRRISSLRASQCS